MELKFHYSFEQSEDFELLIVPYGIEITSKVGFKQILHFLLIVPYGIEILSENRRSLLPVGAFNRTLWN